nr:unnamed protein product [Digitaria exilis]
MNKAKEFWVVQKEVAELIKGRILVGHALHNDLKIEDARAAMFIYNKHKKGWEKNMKEQFRFKKKLKKRGKKKPAESNVNDPNIPTVLL